MSIAIVMFEDVTGKLLEIDRNEPLDVDKAMSNEIQSSSVVTMFHIVRVLSDVLSV